MNNQKIFTAYSINTLWMKEVILRITYFIDVCYPECKNGHLTELVTYLSWSYYVATWTIYLFISYSYLRSSIFT